MRSSDRRLLLDILVALLALFEMSGCADMPRGAHGERLAIRHGWLEVAQVSDRCVYEQRATQLQVRCII